MTNKKRFLIFFIVFAIIFLGTTAYHKIDTRDWVIFCIYWAFFLYTCIRDRLISFLRSMYSYPVLMLGLFLMYLIADSAFIDNAVFMLFIFSIFIDIIWKAYNIITAEKNGINYPYKRMIGTIFIIFLLIILYIIEDNDTKNITNKMYNIMRHMEKSCALEKCFQKVEVTEGKTTIILIFNKNKKCSQLYSYYFMPSVSSMSLNCNNGML